MAARRRPAPEPEPAPEPDPTEAVGQFTAFDATVETTEPGDVEKDTEEESETEEATASSDVEDDVTVEQDDHPPVTRTTAIAWWCPVCDRSHPHNEGVCDGCGYIR